MQQWFIYALIAAVFIALLYRCNCKCNCKCNYIERFSISNQDNDIDVLLKSKLNELYEHNNYSNIENNVKRLTHFIDITNLYNDNYIHALSIYNSDDNIKKNIIDNIVNSLNLMNENLEGIFGITKFSYYNDEDFIKYFTGVKTIDNIEKTNYGNGDNLPQHTILDGYVGNVYYFDKTEKYCSFKYNDSLFSNYLNMKNLISRQKIDFVNILKQNLLNYTSSDVVLTTFFTHDIFNNTAILKDKKNITIIQTSASGDKRWLDFNIEIIEYDKKHSDFTNKVIDLRDSNKNYFKKNIVNPIKNQGHCGSCWIFATISAIESFWAIKNQTLWSLSEQNMLDNKDIKYKFWNGKIYNIKGCTGGMTGQGLNINNIDIQSDKMYMYQGDDTYPLRNYKSKSIKLPNFNDIQVGFNDQHPLNKYSDLYEALVNHGSLTVAISGSILKNYIRGIIVLSNNSNPNHAVNIIKLPDSIQDDYRPYMTIRNSWGIDWGENGYFNAHIDNIKSGIFEASYINRFDNTILKDYPDEFPTSDAFCDTGVNLSPNNEICIDKPIIDKKLYSKYNVSTPQGLIYKIFGDKPGGDLTKIFLPKDENCRKNCCIVKKDITSGQFCKTNADCCDDEECKLTAPTRPTGPMISLCMKKQKMGNCSGVLVKECESVIDPLSKEPSCNNQYVEQKDLDGTIFYVQCGHNPIDCDPIISEQCNKPSIF